MKINKTSLPEKSLVVTSLKKFDYEDAFLCKFQSAREITVDDLVFAFFHSAPKWVEVLFNLRNKIVRLIGLKVPDLSNKEEQIKNFKVEQGAVIGLFKVFDRTQNEVLMGEDDRHLNFRISFLLEKKPENTYSFILSTTVLIHNFLGKIYFFPVKPFHKLVVHAMMKKIIQRVSEN